MTYALLARCPRGGQFGIACASFSIAVGRHCDGAIRANTGATLTLGFPNPRNNYLAINLLGAGHAPAHVLRELVANDPEFEYRQIAIVDREGNAVARSGSKLRAWSGHRTGNGYVAFGDMLAGAAVLQAMATAFEQAPQSELDERLLAALEAARDAGGMTGSGGRLPERSAALVLWGHRTYNEIDLRVDLHDRAVDDLRRIYVDYKPSVAYYEERAKSPRNAIPAMEFADMLKARQQEEAT